MKYNAFESLKSIFTNTQKVANICVHTHICIIFSYAKIDNLKLQTGSYPPNNYETTYRHEHLHGKMEENSGSRYLY